MVTLEHDEPSDQKMPRRGATDPTYMPTHVCTCVCSWCWQVYSFEVDFQMKMSKTDLKEKWKLDNGRKGVPFWLRGLARGDGILRSI